jgi:monovalent cation/hydrogen antiporter
LPESFPQRDLIVFCAFWVTLGTLALQGLTLAPLMRHLTLPEDNTVTSEIQLARQQSARAALDMLRAHEPHEAAAAHVLLEEYSARIGWNEGESGEDVLSGLQTRAVLTQRNTLVSLRRDGTIGDDAYHAIEEELDIIELTATPMIRTLRAPGQESAPEQDEAAPAPKEA